MCKALKTFFSNRSNSVESIKNCIELRFADTRNDDNPVIKGMVILNVELWQKITDERQTFATDYVNNCVFISKTCYLNVALKLI